MSQPNHQPIDGVANSAARTDAGSLDADADAALGGVDTIAEEVDDAAVADEADEVAVDPVEEFTQAMRLAPGEWYVVHSYAGYENRVKANLESRTVSLNMEDFIFQVEVPQEDVIEIKNGQRKNVRRNKFPGYVLVRMDLTDESWSAVRNTPGVTGFVGHGHQPAPLTLNEVVTILAPEPDKKDRPLPRSRCSTSRSATRSP